MGEKRGNFNRCKVQTDGLVNWISNVRVKKNALKRSRRKNLRVEAMLTSALVKAEMQLRVKQLQRFHRWQRVKSEVCKTGFDVCNDIPKDKVSNQWDEKTCEDLKSLDRFMRMLNEVKSPVQR
jgi:fructosamine-3-kinase